MLEDFGEDEDDLLGVATNLHDDLVEGEWEDVDEEEEEEEDQDQEPAHGHTQD